MRYSLEAVLAGLILTSSIQMRNGQTSARSARSTGIHTILTPPVGWNSWDSYGTTVNESQVKANANWMAERLKSYGWQYLCPVAFFDQTRHL